MLKDECIFCKIIKGVIPSFKVFEDEFFLGFLDINPLSKGHTIIIPKEHFSTIFDLPEDLSNKLFKNIKLIAENIIKNLNADGFNLLQNNFKAAGQEIDHFHFHIIPRWNNDKVFKEIIKSQHKVSNNELLKIQKLINFKKISNI